MFDHIGIVFDSDGRTFRHDLYSDYKGGRSRPDELVQQFPLMRDVVRAFGLVPLEMSYYEADDLIATYARLGLEAGHTVVIVTFDKDLYQLVSPTVAVYCPAVGDPRFAGYRPEKWISDYEVIEKFGVAPAQVVDIQALMGDATDCVPGVPKVGVKTAMELIQQFGTVENVINLSHLIAKPKLREAIQAHAHDIRLSRQLVTLLDDIDVKVPLDALKVEAVDPWRLLEFCDRMEFVSLRRRTLERFGLAQEAANA